MVSLTEKGCDPGVVMSYDGDASTPLLNALDNLNTLQLLLEAGALERGLEWPPAFVLDDWDEEHATAFQWFQVNEGSPPLASHLKRRPDPFTCVCPCAAPYLLQRIESKDHFAVDQVSGWEGQ